MPRVQRSSEVRPPRPTCGTRGRRPPRGGVLRAPRKRVNSAAVTGAPNVDPIGHGGAETETQKPAIVARIAEGADSAPVCLGGRKSPRPPCAPPEGESCRRGTPTRRIRCDQISRQRRDVGRGGRRAGLAARCRGGGGERLGRFARRPRSIRTDRSRGRASVMPGVAMRADGSSPPCASRTSMKLKAPALWRKARRSPASRPARRDRRCAWRSCRGRPRTNRRFGTPSNCDRFRSAGRVRPSAMGPPDGSRRRSVLGMSAFVPATRGRSIAPRVRRCRRV
jgi:hypothetical protein